MKIDSIPADVLETKIEVLEF